MIKESASSAGDPGWIPGSGRFPGGGNGNPLHYSCLESLLDRGAWRDTVRGVAKSQTQIMTNTFTSLVHLLVLSSNVDQLTNF